MSALTGQMALFTPEEMAQTYPLDSRGSLTGLLSPEGKFFPCEYCCHDETFGRIHESDPRLPRSYESAHYLHVSEDWWREGTHSPTQAQLDFVFDWAMAVGKKLPTWLIKRMDER